ncbi:PDZ domain-containing protein [Aminipila butyrica]|uniref:PDZ domain-containing protein n=1 Tax=Aminipila butyrica TaxID=433296 RepID=A0A858BTN5_9FIRM|nr:S41 family peptidase [Aminipila butyrica]QIB68134.1 PDZ domain-containing protein [Aminipila butyrica]
MDKKTVKVIAWIIVLTMILTSFSFVIFLPAAFADTKEDTTSKEYLLNRLVEMQNYMEFLNKYYKDPVNYDQLMDAAMDGATQSLEDPYSVFYTTDAESQQFVENVSGEYAGVGLTMTTADKKHEVVSVNGAGPALKAGVEAGDQVIKVDGKDVSALNTNELVQLMRGEKGTKVTLTILRDGQQKDITITREIVTTASISYEMKGAHVGYIDISGFDSDVATEFRMAKAALVNKGAESLIIDLRDNPGGYIDGAVEIANEILPSGYITHFINKDNVFESEKATGIAGPTMPIVLLVNEETASSSELLAGALQDNKAATLVGTTTFGKGIAQQIVTLSAGDKAKVSVFYFVTPNKKTIHHVGITPDYVVRNGTVGSEEAKAKYLTFAPMSEDQKPKAGDTGLNVYGAQQRLSLIGYYTGDITGTMDENTVAAVKKFQKDEALFAYGVIDNTTKNRLELAAYSLAYGNTKAGEDLQLAKALELLGK